MYHFETQAEDLAYKTAIRKASRPYNTVYGTLTFPDNTTMSITDSIIPSNSLSISRQCIDDDELMFGGVFSGMLKISLLTDLERYAFYGAKIELTFKIEVEEDTFLEVPLGVFTVADAERPTDRVTLTCYDNMTLLDKQLGGVFITGTPWEVFQIVSQITEIPLGFTEADLTAFPNYTYQLDATEERGIHTYRDVVKEICQLLGCFAYADRDGSLQIKGFSNIADTSLTRGDWYTLLPADYTCKYVGLTVSSLAGTYSAHTSGLLDQGLVMVIEDAPAWDVGSDEAQQAKTDNLFNYLQLIDEYTPVDMDMPSDPTFDCGDRVELITKNGTIYTLVTSLEWRFHQGMSIESNGLNPYLEGGSVLASESSRILAQAVEKSKLQFISFTNAGERVARDNETVKIGECIFNPSAKTDALFVATILVDVDVDDISVTTTEEVDVPVKAFYGGQETVITDINGNPVSLTGKADNTYTYERDGKCELHIFYKLNAEMVPSDAEPYIAIEEIENGRHIITVSYPLIALEPHVRYEFEVYITSLGGVTTIPIRTLQASIIGQELTDVSGFDGLIRAEDMDFTLDRLADLGVVTVSDNGALIINEVPYLTVSDNVLLYNINDIGEIPLAEGTGSLEPQIYMRSGFDLLTENGFYFAPEGMSGARFITEGQRGGE